MQDFIPQPSQKLAIPWLIERKEAALFAGMGLGKTTSVLAAFKHLLSGLEIRGMLIVAPLRVSVLTWPHEVKKWKQFHKLKIYSLRTKEGRKAWREKTGDIYTINYEMIPKFCKEFLDGKESSDLPVDLVVFDEISAAKSHQSKRINTFRKHRKKFSRAWGLTGTPTPNSLLDVFAQVRLLDEGTRLGRSFETFRSCYFTIDPPEDPRNKYSQYPKHYLRSGKQKIIEEKISDLALTLRSEDWLMIPPTHLLDVDVNLPPKAKAQYKELEKKLLLELEDGFEVAALSAAAMATKLLQITGGAVYDENREVGFIHNKKIEALRDIQEKEESKPLLVAINYKHERARVLATFPEAEEFSEDAYDRWNKGKIKMLVAHPKSVGHGLNLQAGGSIIVWFTLSWSQELYQQMNARLARSGQTEETTIYRLICPDTIDDAVAEVLRNKTVGQSQFMETMKNLQEMRKS